MSLVVFLLAWPPDSPPAKVADVTRPASAGTVRFEFSHAPDGKPGPALSPDGKRTVKLVDDLRAQVVDVGSGAAAGPVLCHSRRRPGMRLHAWAFSPDGRLLATASSQGEGEDTVGEVRVWEVGGGRLLAVATDARYPLGRVRTIAFAPDGKTVLVHCDDVSGK
jgi:WD40 repeat protein